MHALIPASAHKQCTCTHMDLHTCSPAHTCASTHVHTHVPAHAPAHMCTHVSLHTHMHLHTHTCTCTRVYTCDRSQEDFSKPLLLQLPNCHSYGPSLLTGHHFSSLPVSSCPLTLVSQPEHSKFIQSKLSKTHTQPLHPPLLPTKSKLGPGS